MGSWRNQYMDLVETKPGLIIAESDLTIRECTIPTVLQRREEYSRCIVELGSGSGGHVIELAARNPDALCVGFELRFKRTYRTAEKAEERGLKNVLMLRTDAKHLSSLFPQGSVDEVYVNFPDPWEKAKWRKNRLLSKISLPRISGVLKNGGVIRYKTDHRNYFDDVLEDLKSFPEFKVTAHTYDLYSSEYLVGNIPTEFEGLFRSQGLPICFLEAALVR